MNKHRGLTLAVIASVLMMTGAALARDKNHHGVVIPETLQVGTSRLAAGQYTMEWKESGSTAEVSFLQNGKSVAQAPAKIVNLSRKAELDSVTMKTQSGDTQSLEEVQFSGSKQAFSFSDTPSGE
ncbi:MAG: hypothetical protein ABR881_01365 [Candidatus Sulfotelmatobacter sp.]|jgi:hypothetical protein